SAEVRATFENAKKDLDKSKGIKLSSIEDYDLLHELILSGVLGIRLIDNKLYFIGPDDYGIRYDKEKKEFVKGFSKLNMQQFYEIPHSFLPSHYWEQRYRKLIEETMLGKLEGEPLWSYEWQYGVSWEKVDHLRLLYEKFPYFRAEPTLVDKAGFVLHQWSRKNSWWDVYVFEVSQFVSRDTISSLKGYAMELIRKIRDSKDYLEKEKFFINIYSASESWSPLAWAEAHTIAREDIWSINVKRGNDILLELLNRGLLGFIFREKNQITLAGPDIPAIRKSESAPEGLEKPAIS
ncbi:MAG: hypothetical protein H3Z51_00350, partial [archaeon]|nr:hypothetical protein [archaeon]